MDTTVHTDHENRRDNIRTLAPETSEPMKRECARGIVLKRRLRSDRHVVYYLYVPTTSAPRPPVFVSVHGVSRNAREHARLFAPFAERSGVVLVAPRFHRRRFRDYQRLGTRPQRRQADHYLKRILQEVSDLTGAARESLLLFGYSGGGQFVHRFAMANPEIVKRYVVGAAGWYTFPDPMLKYPRGITTTASALRLQFDPDKFLRIPATVVVGEHDTRAGAVLKRSRRIVTQQGSNRFERGHRWVRAMKSEARRTGLGTAFEFLVIPGVAHSFTRAMRNGGMGELVFFSLLGSIHSQVSCG